MDIRKLKPPLTPSIVVLFGAILLSLHLMSSATQDSSQLGRMYSWLLLVNTVGSALLLGLIVANLYSLLKQLRRRTAGSRLTARMVFVFVLLTLTPASIVFYYSMQFLQRSIDSWFDVKIDRAMEDALELGQAALDERMRRMLKQTEQLADRLANLSEPMAAIMLGEQREGSEDAELTVFGRQARIIASSGVNPRFIVPDLPGEGILLQLKQGKSYVGLEPTPDEGLQVRAVVSISAEDALYLQALYTIPEKISRLAGTVESAYAHYKELNYLRGSLKTSFALTLSLVLLLSLLAAIWAAFLSIRRIVAPVRYLAKGTRAVAEGYYEQRLPVKSRDELGFLVESFNAMTEKIAQARDDAQRSRQEVERQRAYLETVLANLSSGVMSFDARMCLHTANHAADTILHTELGACLAKPIAALADLNPSLTDLMNMVSAKVAQGQAIWQEELPFNGPNGRQELLCRGTPLFSVEGDWVGIVVVFDDVTALIQAQRKAAWSEVAQRLAHEIKNPLTPIQLSAERLKHKLAKSLSDEDAAVLGRAIQTIIQQVEAMKTMVNAFSEYAKPSIVQLQHTDLTSLIEQVVALYPPSAGIAFELSLDSQLPAVLADPVRIRQVLHNLIKNAREAIKSDVTATMIIRARPVLEGNHPFVEIAIRDNGPGIASDQADRIFEPYVTTKAKGTGLGLAIVKKIVEEHGGAIWVETGQQTGAGFIIRLPATVDYPLAQAKVERRQKG